MLKFFNIINAALRQFRVAGLTLADQLVHSGANFVTGVIVGRALSISDLGSFSLGMSLLIFSLVFQDNLLATPYTYHLYKAEPDDRKQLRAGAMIQSLLLAGVCSVFLLALSTLPIMSDQDAELETIFLALSLSLPAIFLRECLRRQFFAEFHMARALKLDIGVCFLQFLLFYAGWEAGILTPYSVFFAMALAAATGAFISIYIIRKELVFKAMNVAGDTRANILFGRWLMVGSICHLGSLYSYPWIIYLLHGKAEAGAFSACFSLINLLNPFILGFNNYFRPKIIQTHMEQGIAAMHRLIGRTCLLFLPAGIAMVLFLILTGGFLVQIIYGAAFTGLGLIVGILGLSIMAILLSAPLQLGILALGKPQFNPMFHMVALAATLAVGAPLTLVYGTTGAAIGYVLATSAGTLALAWLYRREIKRA